MTGKVAIKDIFTWPSSRSENRPANAGHQASGFSTCFFVCVVFLQCDRVSNPLIIDFSTILFVMRASVCLPDQQDVIGFCFAGWLPPKELTGFWAETDHGVIITHQLRFGPGKSLKDYSSVDSKESKSGPIRIRKSGKFKKLVRRSFVEFQETQCRQWWWRNGLNWLMIISNLNQRWA